MRFVWFSMEFLADARKTWGFWGPLAWRGAGSYLMVPENPYISGRYH
jgi:hypothetical protein